MATSTQIVDVIPFRPGENNYELVVAFPREVTIFDVHWNAKEGYWYFDLRNQDYSPILCDIKVVLGLPLGHSSSHPWFQRHALMPVDTSQSGKEAGYDDLGMRVLVMHKSLEDLRLG